MLRDRYPEQRCLPALFMRGKGALLPVLLLATACKTSTPPIDFQGINPTAPGVSCGPDLQYIKERGCIDEEATLHPGPLVVQFKNQMGPGIELLRASFALDGLVIYHWNGGGGRDAAPDPSAPNVFEGETRRGEHEVLASLAYRERGAGAAANKETSVFSIRVSRTFTIDPEEQTVVTVTAYERGDATTPLENRPAAEFTLTTRER